MHTHIRHHLSIPEPGSMIPLMAPRGMNTQYIGLLPGMGWRLGTCQISVVMQAQQRSTLNAEIFSHVNAWWMRGY